MTEQTKVTGYTQLTEEQKIFMNEIKHLGNNLGKLLDELPARALTDNLGDVDERALEIAKTNIQTGLMWANRAIAKPTTFC